MNPVTPMERVLAARPGIVVGNFCKGSKICLGTEAKLLPLSQRELLVVQHKSRYIGCHMVHSLETRALSLQRCLAAFMGFLATFFFNL